MAKKVIKRKATTVLSRNGNTITEAQYFSKIRSILRSGFRYWVPMQQALKLASRPSQSLNKRLKTEYKCKHCNNWFKKADVEIDHVLPAGSLNTYEDIVPFIKNLTPEDVNAFQILCKPCHLIKSNSERQLKKKTNGK